MDKLKVVIVFLLCIIGLGFGNMTKKISDRLFNNIDYFGASKIVPSNILDGNIIFIARSSSSWIFSPTDFNYSYFLNQCRLNRSTDTIFNCSFIEINNIKQLTADKRTLLDASIYWSNQDILIFLKKYYDLKNLLGLKSINPNEVLHNFAAKKKVSYFLVDNISLSNFSDYELVSVFYPGAERTNKLYSYSLIDTINLIKCK
jgi:hypothetical protein